MSDNKDHQYDDIINLPHHVSTTRAHMPIYDRAAQFAPFAALTGHDAAVKETARLTEGRHELDEGTKQILDERLQLIRSSLKRQPQITVTYFVPDTRKEGGKYVTVSGRVEKINEYKHILCLEKERYIPIDEIINIEGEFIERVEE